MNEWFKKMLDQVKTLWSKWTLVQKLILIGSIVGAVGALVLVMVFSSAPTQVAVLSAPITQASEFQAVTGRLEQEGFSFTTTKENMVYVADTKTAQKARAILIRENLIPQGTDPWAIFDVDRWTITDFERNINVRRAVTAQVEQHIRALDDVDDVSLNLVLPEDKLFSEDQNPVTASVKLSLKPGSDFGSNRKKVEGVEKLIMFAVEGLKKENIVITDSSGMQLNDFTNLQDIDRLSITEREMKIKKNYERQYKNDIYNNLKDLLTPERVRVINMDITLNTDKQNVKKTEITPIVMEEDNPLTPYSERTVVQNIPISETKRDLDFTGTGFNPEGPAGQEGQTPPGYKDMENLVGHYTDKSNTVNYGVNQAESTIEKSTWSVSRLTIGVAVDGRWEKVYDDLGERKVKPNGSLERIYVPPTTEDMKAAQGLVEAAVGFNRMRGDLVTVSHFPFDRTSEHQKEDDEYRAAQQMQRTIFFVIIGMALILVSFVAFRLISKEMERRRRLKEEELARQHQMMREKALQSAEEEGVDVEMSVAERARLELQEMAINTAREHPADVAQLIRTWLAEE